MEDVLISIEPELTNDLKKNFVSLVKLMLKNNISHLEAQDNTLKEGEILHAEVNLYYTNK